MNHYPILDMQSPEGERSIVTFQELLTQSPEKVAPENTKVTIGRWDKNDIPLDDPQKNISREHCHIAYVQGQWCVVDLGSANGTYIRRAGLETEVDVRSHDRVALQGGDCILILGQWSPDDRPMFWQLTFNDPGKTVPRQGYHPPAVGAEYHLTQQQLYLVYTQTKEPVSLTPQQQALIDHMARRNKQQSNGQQSNGQQSNGQQSNGQQSNGQQSNGQDPQQAVVCTYDELIEAIWGDRFGHHRNEINRLVWGIRPKLEADPGEPRFLQTVRGQGYRLLVEVMH